MFLNAVSYLHHMIFESRHAELLIITPRGHRCNGFHFQFLFNAACLDNSLNLFRPELTAIKVSQPNHSRFELLLKVTPNSLPN